MITISCEKNWRFSQKPKCYDHIFAKTNSSLCKKRQFFRQNFGENVLKIITSTPDWANFILLGDRFLFVVF
jgi:hypothetical protein